ncbi:MAG: glutamate 5-kinase [Oscillospiraceae bacterium]|nr:glutamate 5-kinase [Oscillospiraceae bacterium]
MKDKLKRVVIKVGTSTLTHPSGQLNIRHVEELVKVISDIKNSGVEIVLVTSGAIGLGAARLGMKERPKDTPTKQACAAVGQCELMNIYEKYFNEYGIIAAQVLLTKFVLTDERKENVINSLGKVLELGAIPIVNENDVVAIDELELEVGENDTLAAIVAVLTKADTLIIMSDIDGLYECDPKVNSDAKLISKITEVSDDLLKIAGGSASGLGTGGMATKLKAAKIALSENIDMMIINGKRPTNLYDVFDGKQIGTLFTTDKE